MPQLTRQAKIVVATIVIGAFLIYNSIVIGNQSKLADQVSRVEKTLNIQAGTIQDLTASPSATPITVTPKITTKPTVTIAPTRKATPSAN